MFAQFFGGYLFNHKLCTAEDLTQAFEAKSIQDFALAFSL